MANGVWKLLAIIAFLNILSSDGRQFGRLKGLFKTIKTDDGEIIDCVDIHKQPAFSHPLLKNHTIQLEPSFDTRKLTTEGGRSAVEQRWHKYGECPQGSIPIVRKQGNSPTLHPKSPRNSSFSVQDQTLFMHHWALVKIENKGNIKGAHAKIDNWSPFVNPEDGSMSQIWLSAGPENTQNIIQFGWQVVPTTGKNYATMFIYWTNDNYKTGCYNLECPGFVQTSQSVAVGAQLGQLSAYGGVQYDTEFDVRQDPQTHNWWLTINGVQQGYFPANLLPIMFGNNADTVAWGGEAIFKMGAHYHYDNPTQMGSGHFPDEGYTRSSYMTQLKYIDIHGAEIIPNSNDFKTLITGDLCYDLAVKSFGDSYSVYYGGPGCQD